MHSNTSQLVAECDEPKELVYADEYIRKNIKYK